MSNLNPNALALWLFLVLLGFLIGGWHYALIGLTVGVGISLAVSLIGE